MSIHLLIYLFRCLIHHVHRGQSHLILLKSRTQPCPHGLCYLWVFINYYLFKGGVPCEEVDETQNSLISQFIIA